MPAKGMKNAKEAIQKILAQIAGPMTETAVTEVLIVAAGYAATMTPIETSNLINSQYRSVVKNGDKVVGTLGYTANYAAAVHDAKGVLLGKNVLRSKKNPSRGVVWAPDGEPEFLRKAFEGADARADIDATIKRRMKI